jgi:nucleotide-binding universal stress UspA family protein
VPVDGGHLTHLVLDWADFIAGRAKAGVVLMHVFDPRIHDADGLRMARDTQWLSNLEAESHAHVDTKSLTAVGKPADEILAVAGRLDADLVVIGRRGRRRVLSGVVGSTARVTCSDIRRARC